MFQVSILTPEGSVYEGEVVQVRALTLAGQIGILARHTPLLSILKPGVLTIKKDKKGEESSFGVSGGMIEVRRDGRVIVLADTAEVI